MLFVAALLWFGSSVAFGQESVATAAGVPFLEQLMKGDFIAKILAVMVGVQFILRGVAEGLTRISVYTESNWDNKIAAYLSEASWLVGSIIGKFGVGVPKLVIEESAKKVEAPKV